MMQRACKGLREAEALTLNRHCRQPLLQDIHLVCVRCRAQEAEASIAPSR